MWIKRILVYIYDQILKYSRAPHSLALALIRCNQMSNKLFHQYSSLTSLLVENMCITQTQQLNICREYEKNVNSDRHQVSSAAIPIQACRAWHAQRVALCTIYARYRVEIENWFHRKKFTVHEVGYHKELVQPRSVW